MIRLTPLDSRYTPTAIFAADGLVYTESGAFQPFEGYTGFLDVSLAGDVNGNGSMDVAIGGGEGGGPRVTIMDTRTRQLITNFFAFEPSFRGGVNVAVDGSAGELLVGAGRGGAPVVVAYDLQTFREVRRAFYGPEGYRGGIQVDADSISRAETPSITLGNGSFPIYLDLDGLRAFEVRYVVSTVYDLFSPLDDLIRVTTVQPRDYPSNYVTASRADLGYFPITVSGLAVETLRNRQPDSFHRLEVFADDSVSIGYLPYIFAHELGHLFGLAHSTDPDNVMYAPAPNGGKFSDLQIEAMANSIAGGA